MTSTSQAKGDEGKDGSAPAKAAASVDEPKAVPLGEHIELRQKHADSSKRVEELETELAKLKSTKAPADPKNPSGLDDLHKTVREIQHRENCRSIMGELGLTDEKAASKVVELMTAKGLDAREALSIAAMREPEVFASRDRATGGEPQFASLTPRPGNSPAAKPDESKRWSEHHRNLRGKDEKAREALLDNAIGHHLAEPMGWNHHYTQLPQP